MSNPLDTYHIDHLEANGGYMKLQPSGDKGFTTNDFQDLQLKMIQSNNIPRLLPISLEEVNGETSIFYKTEGLRKLRPFAKERPLSMQNYYSLFINIIQALQDSNNHMLSDDHFILDEDYIFIGNGYHQVYLTYVPLKEVPNNQTVHEGLKKLLLNLASEVQGLNGAQFKMLLSYIKDPGFSLHGIKQLLSQLQRQTQYGEEEEQEEQEETQQPKEITKIKKVRKLPPLTSKNKTYSILMGVIILAMIWKLYSDGPTSFWLIVSSILSLIVIAGVLVYWFVWRPGVEPTITEKEVKVKNKQAKQLTTPKSKPASETKQQEAADSFQAAQTMPAMEGQQPAPEMPASPSFTPEPAFPFETPDEEEIPSNDQTMLLDEEKVAPKPNKKAVVNYLTVDRDGIEEEIQLDKDSFTIGRAEKGTDFVEKGVGISRLHVEFVKLSDTYGIKDLGAKNGTYVNAEKIIPYKIHELSDQDTIQIGKTVYTYRVTE
ncbi:MULTISPECIES: DUF6382 domain-containing protein [Gracilibacillus]|uniref:DUF6382 domain-containing protein n=1 Tax=Gracilibacillus TaxID=74385 RepID=UPI0008245233|nr:MULTISPECIES: DUF6382 domain-containing protein [Gracilibacillus]